MTTQLNTDIEKTELLPYSEGSEKIINEESEFFSRAKNRIDIFIDHTQPQLVIQNEEIKKSIFDAKSRNARTRCITEITNSNLPFCKELMKITGGLRHLEGVKANFMVSEKEYLLTPLGLSHNGKSQQQKESLSCMIYSNLKETVEQRHYLFESLWNRANPAEEIIKKIEKGIEESPQHYEIKIIRNPEEIVKELISLNERSNELFACTTAGGMQFVYTHLFNIKRKLLDKQKEGKHRGIRYISEINKDNIELAKIFVDFGIQLRHTKNLTTVMSFGLTDKEIAATIERMENGNNAQSLLISNDPTYLNNFRNIFEELWKNAIKATDRIKDIEEGSETDDELADAKHYLNEVLEEISNMKNNANQ